jgi:hypothetical protein
MGLSVLACGGDDGEGGFLDQLGNISGVNAEWTKLGVQPCTGTRPDAMWFDSAREGYLGCGTNANGEGLFWTSDAGQSWERVEGSRRVRVLDVRRGPDGKLYGSGRDADTGAAVFEVTGRGATREFAPLYVLSRQAFLLVNQGENLAILQGGQMFVDSLTGTQTAWRSGEGAAFEELGTFLEEGIDDPDAVSVQMARVIAAEGRFGGAGSRINARRGVRAVGSRGGDVSYEASERAA